MLFFAAFLVFVEMTSAQITTPGSCDTNVTTVKNFDMEKYSGVWHEIYRYEQTFQFGGDCVTATYTPENGNVKVFNRMVLRGNAVQITGTASVDPDAAGDGKLIVNFPSVHSTAPYWVLSTDYTGYSLVYLCTDLSDGRKQVSSWILSRKQILSPQSVIAMNNQIQAIDGLDWDSYRQTNQTESGCALKDPSAPPMTIGKPSFVPAMPAKAAAYAGLWYETYRYEQEFQFSGDCVTASYTRVNETINVLNSMVVKGTKYTIEGTVIVAPDANGRGKLLVNFPSVGTQYSDYWVLSTDYTNYSLVFGCHNYSNTTKKVSSWVLSRKPTLSPQSVLAMNDALESTEGLSWDKYRETNQSDTSCQINWA